MNRDHLVYGQSRSLRLAFTPPVTKAQDLFAGPNSDFDGVLFWARLAAAQSRKSRERLLREARVLLEMSEIEGFLAEFVQWRTSEVFTARQKAAMELSESISLKASKKCVKQKLKNAQRHFKTEEMVRLTLSIEAINDWYDALPR